MPVIYNKKTDGSSGTGYVKPTSGIPLSDLAGDVQTSINSIIPKNQGTANAGKELVVGTDGNVVAADATSKFG